MKKHLSTILLKSRRSMRKGIPLVLGVVMLLSMFAPASQPAQAASCTQYYRVRAGQTLYSIGLIYAKSRPPATTSPSTSTRNHWRHSTAVISYKKSTIAPTAICAITTSPVQS